MTTADAAPKLFRMTLEVANLPEAVTFYQTLFGIEGEGHPGARHYFNCGGIIISIIDPTRGGLTPQTNAKSLYFAVEDLEAVHARAQELNALAPYQVHGAEAGAIVDRPWGERSFYVNDPWGNDLCFVQEGTLYT